MNELFKKVISGKYPKIADRYSSNLSNLLSILLQVSSIKRPTCAQLLMNPIIQKYSVEVDKLFNISYSSPPNNPLLNAIKLPKNIKHLSKHLPMSN